MNIHENTTTNVDDVSLSTDTPIGVLFALNSKDLGEEGSKKMGEEETLWDTSCIEGKDLTALPSEIDSLLCRDSVCSDADIGYDDDESKEPKVSGDARTHVADCKLSATDKPGDHQNCSEESIGSSKRIGRQKLDDNTVREIYMIGTEKQHPYSCDIGYKYGVHRSMIQKIWTRKSFKHLTKDLPPYIPNSGEDKFQLHLQSKNEESSSRHNIKKCKLDVETIVEIYMIGTKIFHPSIHEVSVQYGVSMDIVSDIWKRDTWKQYTKDLPPYIPNSLGKKPEFSSVITKTLVEKKSETALSDDRTMNSCKKRMILNEKQIVEIYMMGTKYDHPSIPEVSELLNVPQKTIFKIWNRKTHIQYTRDLPPYIPNSKNKRPLKKRKFSQLCQDDQCDSVGGAAIDSPQPEADENHETMDDEGCSEELELSDS